MKQKDIKGDPAFLEEKEELLKLLLEEEGFNLHYEQEIKPRDKNQIPPLSSNQNRFWIFYHRSPRKITHNLSITLRITGPLLIEPFKRSLNEIIRRHEILRTNFDIINEKPVQIIAPRLNIKLLVISFNHLSEEEQYDEMKRVFNNEALRSFDLTKDQLLRPSLIKFDEENYAFIATIPHLIGDAWSLNILYQEIALLYNAYSEGLPSPLPELPIQYADFACWEQERLNQSNIKTSLDFWKKHLTGTSFYLPTDYPRPQHNIPSKAHFYSVTVPKSTVIMLNSLSHDKKISKFTILLASLYILLSKWTNKEDIIIPIIKANRDRLETEQLIGSMTNLLLIRSKISGNQTGLDFIEQLKTTLNEAFAHQDTPFRDVAQSIYPNKKISQTPFYQIHFNNLVISTSSLILSKEVRAKVLQSLLKQHRVSPFDLDITTYDNGDQMGLSFLYKVGIYESKTIRGIADSFCKILEESCAEPSTKISQFNLSDGFKPRGLLSHLRAKRLFDD